MITMAEPEESAERERRRRLRQRNLALALGLTAFAVIFYIITLYKGVPLITRRPL